MSLLLVFGLPFAFDGAMEGPVLGMEIGYQNPDLVASGGLYPNPEDHPARANGSGFTWAADLGYAWSRFGISGNFSRRYFTSTMWRDSERRILFKEDMKTTVSFIALGANTFFAHHILGAPRYLRLSGESGIMFVNEADIFKTAGFGYSLGVGQELFKHASVEARWLSGGNSATSRPIDLHSLQATLRVSVY